MTSALTSTDKAVYDMRLPQGYCLKFSLQIVNLAVNVLIDTKWCQKCEGLCFGLWIFNIS